MKVKKYHIAESHMRQFDGEDYQRVAVDIAESLNLNPDDEQDWEDYKGLESSPDPGCECRFCENAEWLGD